MGPWLRRLYFLLALATLVALLALAAFAWWAYMGPIGVRHFRIFVFWSVLDDCVTQFDMAIIAFLRAANTLGDILYDPNDRRLIEGWHAFLALLFDSRPGALIAAIAAAPAASHAFLAVAPLLTWATMSLLLWLGQETRIPLILLSQNIGPLVITMFGPHTPALFMGVQLALGSPQIAGPAALLYVVWALWQIVYTLPGSPGQLWTPEEAPSRYRGPRAQLERIQGEFFLPLLWLGCLVALWVPTALLIATFSFWQAFFLLELIRIFANLITALMVAWGPGFLWVYQVCRLLRTAAAGVGGLLCWMGRHFAAFVVRLSRGVWALFRRRG